MTFNLKKADIEAERLRQRKTGLWATHYCAQRYAETKRPFFLEMAKTIAKDFKNLDNVYKKHHDRTTSD